MKYSFRNFQKNAIIRFLELDKYCYIQERTYNCDISKNTNFQTTFNAFYKVRRDKKWREIFYGYFESIKNNTVSKIPISINMLLFGEDQKNIGIVTYCTDRDYGSNYDGFKLNGNQAVPFSINVVKTKYFVNGKTPGDVKYIAVLDENKYCKIGGYSNYEGLTIDEIANGIVPKERQGISLSKYVENLKESGLVSIILTILGIAAGLIF